MTEERSGDATLEEVRRHAVRVASRDRLLAVRPDIAAEDVAQDVVMQFHRLDVKPENWQGWTTVATRHRLIDLARQRRPAAYLESELHDRVERTMGPSGGVIALGQTKEALAVLTDAERDLFGEHLLGATNADLAARYGYASAAVVSTILARIGAKIRAAFPDLHLDLEPQRLY